MTTSLPVYPKGSTVSFPAVHTAGGSAYHYNVKAAAYIGAEVSAKGQCPTCTRDWLIADQSLFSGQLQANKMFYSPGQPLGTWQDGHNRNDQEATLPASVLQLICFDDPKTTPAQVTTYVKSIPIGQKVVMIFSQEYEGGNKWASPSAFFAWFASLSAAARAVGNPGVMVCADSSGYAYSPGGKAVKGNWIVPADLVDIYGMDCYQNQPAGKWPTQGLANYPEFQTWLGLVGHSGKKLMTPEYGVCASMGDAARHDRIALDASYLLSSQVPPWFGWLYWYSDCTAAVLSTDAEHQHQFQDAATIALWTSICAGTF